jgi:hypothetical protein
VFWGLYKVAQKEISPFCVERWKRCACMWWAGSHPINIAWTIRQKAHGIPDAVFKLDACLLHWERSTMDHCRSRCKGREGLPLIHSYIHTLGDKFEAAGTPCDTPAPDSLVVFMTWPHPRPPGVFLDISSPSWIHVTGCLEADSRSA